LQVNGTSKNDIFVPVFDTDARAELFRLGACFRAVADIRSLAQVALYRSVPY